MKVKIKDDKKEKHQSFEAIATVDFSYYKDNSQIVGEVELIGYGADEAEAVESLKMAVTAFKDKQTEISIDFEIE